MILFQEVLKKMRDVDDKIIYSLNTSLSTESFKGKIDRESNCKELYGQLHKIHQHRREAIKECILVAAHDVKKLREEKERDMGNPKLDKKFKYEQRKVS
jgi:hypothetical protein